MRRRRLMHAVPLRASNIAHWPGQMHLRRLRSMCMLRKDRIILGAHLCSNTHTLAFWPRTSSSPENCHPEMSGKICDQ